MIGIKKGCFLASITVFTIILVVIIYTVKYHKDVFSNAVKPFILAAAKKELQEKIGKVKSGEYKDSLNAIFDDYVSRIKKDKNYKLDDMRNIFEEVRLAIKDSTVDSLEIDNLKNILQKDMRKNERPKEN